MKSKVQHEFKRLRPFVRRLLAVCPAITLSLSAAADTISVSQRDIFGVFDSAVSYHHQKTELRKVIDSACYFDPEVEDSMRCSWASGSGGADPFRLEKRVKRKARNWCKKAGGNNCVLFWRNGAFRFEGLHPIQAERLESALLSITTHDSEPLPLPEGGIVGFGLQSRFENIRDYWERYRRRARGRNPHYAVCSNERGPWATVSMQGSGIHISHVRAACVLKCRAISVFLSKEGVCHVVFEDGEFASAAAERAIKR